MAAIDAAGLLRPVVRTDPSSGPARKFGPWQCSIDIRSVRDGHGDADLLDPVTFEADNEALSHVWDIRTRRIC
jgi:hypothetical protein